MGGMSKKRKFGSPGSKIVINEEEEGETGHVTGEKRNTDKALRQDNNRDTMDSTGGVTGGYRRRAGAGVRRRSSTEDQGCDNVGQTKTNEESSEHVTRSGKMYNRMERDKEREDESLSDKVKQGSKDILRRMDKQETCTEDIRRIVREGLMALSDTVEREMTGISERMSEAVKSGVEVEIAKLKDRVERLEEGARTREDMMFERMKKVEERTKESEEKEMLMSDKLERAEDRIKETEDEMKKMEQGRVTERLEQVEERLKDREEEKRYDSVTNRLEKLEERTNSTENMSVAMRQDRESRRVDIDKQKELEDRVKVNEERMESLRQDGERTRRKESEREMRERIEAAGKNLKYFGVDFGSGSRDRRELVERAIRCIEDSVQLKDKKTFKMVFSRTRVTLLGKETKEKHYLGRKINTIPVLLECMTEEDKRVLEVILQEAGWHSSFEWPEECMEFIRETKKEICKLGYAESSHIVKIRPECRNGRIRIKGEVREKKGGRYRVVALWEAPPMDRTLWDREQMRPRLPGNGRTGHDRTDIR